MSPEIRKDKTSQIINIRKDLSAFMITPEGEIHILFDSNNHHSPGGFENFFSQVCKQCPLNGSCQKFTERGEIILNITPSVFVASALCQQNTNK